MTFLMCTNSVVLLLRKMQFDFLAIQEQLEKLNGIVWPAIYELAKAEIDRQQSKGKHNCTEKCALTKKIAATSTASLLLRSFNMPRSRAEQKETKKENGNWKSNGNCNLLFSAPFYCKAFLGSDSQAILIRIVVIVDFSGREQTFIFLKVLTWLCLTLQFCWRQDGTVSFMKCGRA